MAEHIRHPTCIDLGTGGSSPGVGGLCRFCQHNQTIILQLMSAFDPPESSGSFDKLASQYRRDLERRYPLCQSCKFFVDQRLNALSMKLKQKHIGRAKVGGNPKTVQLQGGVPGGSVSVGMALFAILDASLEACLGYLPNAVDWKMVQDVAVAVLGKSKYLWKAIDLFPFVTQGNARWALLGLELISLVASSSSRILRMFLFGLLFVVRMSDHALIVEYQPGILGAIHLVLLLNSLRPIPTRTQPRQQQPPSPIRSLPLTPIEPRVRHENPSTPSPSKTIVRDLLDVDWGLGSSAQQKTVTNSFLGVRLTNSLPTTEKKPMFAPSRLDPSKAVTSFFNTPSRDKSSSFSSLTNLRPSVLSTSRPVGLEGALGGFSLVDQGNQPLPQMNILWELTLSASFLVARLYLRDMVALTAVVLAASFCFRGFVWSRLPSSTKIGISAIAVYRLAFIAGQLSEPDFAALVQDSLVLRICNLFLDLALLAAR